MVNIILSDNMLEGHPGWVLSLKLLLILAHVRLVLLMSFPFFVNARKVLGLLLVLSTKASSFSRRCSRYSNIVICFVKYTGYSCIPPRVRIPSVKGAAINLGPNNLYCTVRCSYLVPFPKTR